MNIEQLQSFFKKVYEEPDGEYLQCLLYPVFEALVNEDLVNEDGWVYRDDIISFINKKYNFKEGDWKRKGLRFDHLFSQRFGKGVQNDFLNELVAHDGVNAGDEKTKYKLKDVELIRKFVDSGFCRPESIKEHMDNRIRYLRQNKILSDDELRNVAISSAKKIKENEGLRNGWLKGLSEHIKKYSAPDFDLTNQDTLNDLFNSEAVCATGQANSFPIENALNDEEFRKLFSEKINNLKAKDHKYLDDYKKLYDELIEELKQRCGSKPLLKLSRALCALFPEHFSVIGNIKTLKHLHDSIFDDKSEHPVEMHFKVFNKLNNLLGVIDKSNTQEFVERILLPWQIQEDLFGDFRVTRQNENKYPKIWKISHGQVTDISDEDNKLLFANNLVAVGYKDSKRQHQRKYFLNIKSNDYFYLVRRSEIILLGQLEDESKEVDEQGKLDFDGISIQLNENMSGWVCRKIKAEVNLTGDCEPTRVVGRKYELPFEASKIEKDCPIKLMKFMPSGRSTVHAVENKYLESFTKYILKPVFNLSLENLSITPSSDNTPYVAAHPKGNKMHYPKNKILFGPPGTGKTYNTVNKAIEIANPEFNLDQPRKEIKSEFDRLMNEGQIVFTTFHQSMCYEDFIEGIKPETTPDDKRVIYDVKPGIFKNLCQAATTPNLIGFNAAYEQLIKKLSEIEATDSDAIEVKTIEIKTPTGKPFSISLNSNNNLSLHTGPNKIKQGTLTRENIQAQINGDVKFIGWNGYFEGVCNYLKENYNYSSTTENTAKNFVLIIDEINRGNVSQIFGELITLIEDDKRLGCPEALKVTLPYSKEKFGVPSNLYIIGTMNTADRSVEALDAALRRRFSFVEMQPDSTKIKTIDKLVNKGIDLSELLTTINERIEKLLDKDHQIGHSYFINIEDLEGLKLAFKNKIIPLLQEYFFGDYGKIGLILGEDFFEQGKPSTARKETFAKFSYSDVSDFSERVIYRFKNITSITDQDFVVAINSLLNKNTDGE